MTAPPTRSSNYKLCIAWAGAADGQMRSNGPALPGSRRERRGESSTVSPVATGTRPAAGANAEHHCKGSEPKVHSDFGAVAVITIPRRPGMAGRVCTACWARPRQMEASMPIWPEMRGSYPRDWRSISRRVRFERAGGVCQGCGRPHGETVCCLPDRRWFDATRHTWRNGRGRTARWPDLDEAARMRQTRVVLAAAHLDHDPTNNRCTISRASASAAT